MVVRVASGFGFDWMLDFVHTSDGSFEDFVVVGVANGFGFDWVLVSIHTSAG